ncbi:hypothetical protein MMC28_009837 [Mycoblastus sanguinarius]|nr:hypothetical protein [Mycoblastus sanguinarius]
MKLTLFTALFITLLTALLARAVPIPDVQFDIIMSHEVGGPTSLPPPIPAKYQEGQTQQVFQEMDLNHDPPIVTVAVELRDPGHEYKGRDELEKGIQGAPA